MGKGYMADSEGVTDKLGDLDSSSSSSGPSVLGLGKKSPLSELQRLIDSVILETDKVKPSSPRQPPPPVSVSVSLCFSPFWEGWVLGLCVRVLPCEMLIVCLA